MADKAEPVIDDGGGSGAPAGSTPADSGPADSGPADSGPADSGPADSPATPQSQDPVQTAEFTDAEGEVIEAPSAEPSQDPVQTVEFTDAEGEVIEAPSGEPERIGPDGQPIVPPLGEPQPDQGDTIGQTTPEDVEDTRREAFERWQAEHEHHLPHGDHTEEETFGNDPTVDSDPVQQEPFP